MLKDGDIFAVDKPKGITSHDVVNMVRRASGIRRVGHAGTLDPMASGVLVILVGRTATKHQTEIMGQTKGYDAEITLGATSTTDDAEGVITPRLDPALVTNITRPQIEKALQSFVGSIQQSPPMFSALKRDGEPLYKKARRGEIIELPPRTVEIYSINVLEWTPPRVRIHVECGSGTYIRSLARDLGEALGIGGHLSALRRTHVGDFTLTNARHSRFSNKKRGGWGSCSFEPTNFPHTPHGSRNTQARCPHFVLVGAQISGCCAANTHLARSESCRCLG